MSDLILPDGLTTVGLSKPKFRKDVQRLINEAYLGLGDTTTIKITNVLLAEPELDLDDPVLYFLNIMRQPENFYFTCKWLLNIELLPFQNAILRKLWKYKFPMLLGSRGMSKSWILALYFLLRGLFNQGSRLVIVGSAFRQSKVVFEYAEGIWKSANILRNICGKTKYAGPKRNIDRCDFFLGRSIISGLPLGDGSKIRGMRANYIAADEFASINKEIFEVVIRGFTAVAENPVARVKTLAQSKQLKNMGYNDISQTLEDGASFGNQTIISGTADYTFNHFYQYWKKYKAIIESKGDKRLLEPVFEGEVPEGFDWKQFCIIRIPYNILPRGFLDEAQISQGKATMSKSQFAREFLATFPNDSEGFIKRSLIESCTCKPYVELSSGRVTFSASLSGSPNSLYIYGLDPASESDNFAIVILEIHPDHRRIVYSWTSTRQKLRERLTRTGKVNDKSFYNYVARKVRELIKIFPTNYIGMDQQGGGISVMEALKEGDYLQDGELPILPYIRRGNDDPLWWEKPDKPTDGEQGLHILNMVQFALPEFTSQANHGLRFDMESKILLFPYFDSLTLAESYNADAAHGRDYDTLEDCVLDIEELKDELSTIIHTQTLSGRDHWDTPSTKALSSKKGRARKDRYTALLIANMLARTLNFTANKSSYKFAAGYVGKTPAKYDRTGKMYVGPDHIVSKMNSGVYGGSVQRGGGR